MSYQYETQHDQIVSEYHLVQKLGGGGFGTVYQAEHIHEHSQVAIKLLRVPLTKSEDFRDFLNEARTMMRLCHPHIIPLLDFGLSCDDLPFLVMEYIPEGKTVQDRHAKSSRVPLAAIVEYVQQMASALQYAHDHHIIHRDVKPQNMLLRADGTLLLSDFGIAKIIEHSTLMSTQTQIGTPAYMAPEQHIGHPCFASDQYALAVVVYEWISGTRPFQGNSLGLALLHMTTLPPSLLNLLPQLPPPIEQVIFKALSKTPEQRFTTMQEFATAFRVAAQEATVPQVDTKRLTLDELLAMETLTQRPITAASPNTEPPSYIPLVSQTHPTNQSIKPKVSQTRDTPAPINNSLSSNQTGTTSPTTHPPQQLPALLPLAGAITQPKPGKALKQLSPLRRNLLLLGAVLLVGLLILPLVISRMDVNLQNSPKISATGPSHPTPTVAVLNANTVSRLAKKWAFSTGGIVTSLPEVVDNVVYVGSADGNVYAIDALSGQKKWSFPTGSKVVSSPKVVNGVVYIGSSDNHIYAIDALSGQQKWAFPTGSWVRSSPTVVDGVVYVGSGDDNLYAIDTLSGQQKWAFPTRLCIASSPAVVDGVVYVGSEDGYVYAIDALSGTQKWVIQTGGEVNSSPIVSNNVVYVGSDDHNVYAIDVHSGQKIWVFPTGDKVDSSPAVLNNVVYIGSDDHSVYAIDALLGKQKWVFLTGDKVDSSPAMLNNVVYVGSDDHNMYAINALSGQKIQAFPMGDKVDSSPAVLNNVVYIGSNDHNVYALGLPTTAS